MKFDRDFCLQVWVENQWFNYSLCRTLEKSIEMAIEELNGNSFRILQYNGETWIEILLRGSMLSVVGKDFRTISA